MPPPSATVLPVPLDGPYEATDPTIEFLRRLAGMMSGGHNAEMLLAAAATIETLRQRVTDAERSCETHESELAHCIALREIAEHGANELAAEVEALKEQLEHTADEAERSRIRFARENSPVRLLPITTPVAWRGRPVASGNPASANAEAATSNANQCVRSVER